MDRDESSQAHDSSDQDEEGLLNNLFLASAPDDSHDERPYFDLDEVEEDADSDYEYDEDHEVDDEDDEDHEDDDDESAEQEFQDALDELQAAAENQIEVEVVIEDGNNGTQVGEAQTETQREEATVRQRLLTLIGAGREPALISHGQLMALLRGSDLTHVLFHEDADDSDDDGWNRRRRRANQDPPSFPNIPSEKGIELMTSGVFGATPTRLPDRKKLARRILDRELGIGDGSFRKANQDLMAQGMIPSTAADMIIHYDSPVYSGQFSDDGNFFFSVVKDFKVRMYDTSNPYNWRHYKTVEYPFGQWTLTDASLSPDNKWLAYSSIQSNVCLAPTNPNDTGDPYSLDLSGIQERRQVAGWGHFRRSFGIWSVRFSGDGRELVAGTNARSLVVYDIESRTVLHHIQGHEYDVNAVCFADKGSPHILYSGSDDTTIKVWDRRSMGDGREAGAFVGHVEGLTYIDSKGDGRYILSNGKDQSMKLWDLRMAYSTERFTELNPLQHTSHSDFDYRWGDYSDADWFPHPNDNSLVTFRGHKVLRTLIRCHFSPPGSTDSRYVYSGSQDGSVYIWNLDATPAGKIDVTEATVPRARQASSDRRYRLHHRDRFPSWGACVRDASWHPHAPIIVASAWSGFDQSSGSCSVHSFNQSDEDDAEPKMGLLVNEKLTRRELN